MSALPKPLPQVQCDLCDCPMTTDHLVTHEDGTWRGLLVCTQCIEDSLAAALPEPRCEASFT